MTTEIRIGLVDFADQTLLLAGDSRAFALLADQIASRQHVELLQTSLAPNAQERVALRFIPTVEGGRLERQQDAFVWSMSDDEAAAVARQLKELAASPVPAHAYLDPQSNLVDVVLLASKGEYDLEKLLPS